MDCEQLFLFVNFASCGEFYFSFYLQQESCMQFGIDPRLAYLNLVGFMCCRRKEKRNNSCEEVIIRLIMHRKRIRNANHRETEKFVEKREKHLYCFQRRSRLVVKCVDLLGFRFERNDSLMIS